MTRPERNFRVFLNNQRQSASSLIKARRIHGLLFTLLVILLPTQLGKHFWPKWSYVFGLKVDYLSPTIYLTDLIILGILVSWGIEIILKTKKKRPKTRTKNLKTQFLFFSFWAFFIVNAFFAQNQPAAFYKLIKIFEFFLLGAYVVKNHVSLENLRLPLSITVFYSSLIALVQFVKQASLNGLFWWLGERTFSVATPGIAKAVLGGRLFLRPYGTFPHPNALAGFILVVLILLNEEKIKLSIKKVWEYLAMVMGTASLALSFSRSTWLIALLSGIWLNVKHLTNQKNRKKQWPLAVTGWLIIFGLFVFFLSKMSFDEAISQRFQLNKAAMTMVEKYPLGGVGLNNFIVRLPEFSQRSEAVRLLQPVHNIFLLVAAETGLVVLLIFVWFLILIFKRLLKMSASRDFFGMRSFALVISLLAILLTGMVDHYWLTLQQTQLLFTIILGLSWQQS